MVWFVSSVFRVAQSQTEKNAFADQNERKKKLNVETGKHKNEND